MPVDSRVEKIENDKKSEEFDVFSALELITPSFLSGEVDNRQWQSRTLSISNLEVSLKEKIRLLKKGIAIIFWHRENRHQRYSKLLLVRESFLEGSFERNLAIASLISFFFSKREIARIYERSLF